jgi:hypothetical protein
LRQHQQKNATTKSRSHEEIHEGVKLKLDLISS